MNKETVSKNILGSFEKSMNTVSHAAVMNESLEGSPKLIKGEVLKGAICIIQNKEGEILGGVSLHEDERKGKVVFVGGTIEEGEDYLTTAKRELREESGVEEVNFSKKVGIGELPNHIFIYGTTDQIKLTPNKEFSSMDWYSPEDFNKQTIPSNQKVLRMLNIIDDE